MGRRGDNPTRDYWRNRDVVYRLYGGGRLLYIGVSGDISTRMAQHRSATPWFPEVERIVVKLAPDRRTAFAVELAAIRAEKPLYNVRHGVGWIEPRARRKAA